MLVVHPATHERLLVHNAKVDNVEQSAQQPNATLAAQPAFAPESLHSVAAALVADPSFTTAIAAAVAASNPTMKEVSSSAGTRGRLGCGRGRYGFRPTDRGLQLSGLSAVNKGDRWSCKCRAFLGWLWSLL